MKTYKYILWDIDGTILNFEAAERASIRTLFQKYNLGECTDEMLQRYSVINVKYWQAMERGEMTKPEILVGRFREFFTLEGIDPEVADPFNSDYQIALGDTIVINDDALEIIREQKKSCCIVIITNGTLIAQKKKLKESGLNDLADYIFISEEVGFEKPRKEYFQTVLDTVGISDVREALIIGDSLTSDIQGGHNMGIDTCWYNPFGKTNDSALMPTYTITNLHEIEQIVEDK